MTCKDCYHYEKCYYDALTEELAKGHECQVVPCIDNHVTCKHFKDKSQIIELPMKATDKLKEELTKHCYERCVDEL